VDRRQISVGKTQARRQLLLEQLLGHAFPQYSEGSFGNDFSNGSGDCFGYRVFRSTRLSSGTLQQIGKQFSLGHAEDALVAQQGAGETIDHLSCCHLDPPGADTQIRDRAIRGSEGD
jgi:hypothetical protein